MKRLIDLSHRYSLITAIAVSIATLFLCSSARPVCAQEATLDTLDQLATIGYPGAYSEFLSYYVDKGKDSVDEATKLIHEDLTKYNQYISRVVAVVDVLNKVGQGQGTDATLSAALTGISELAATEQGKAFLKLYNIAPPMVTALITAVQVAWESKKAVDESTVGLKLETLYGTIEFDPVLKSSDRELGQGNPIPVTPQTVDYVWKKVVTNDRFRDLFRVYYTEEQGKSWPQTSFWEFLSMSLDDTTDKRVLEQADTMKLYENRDEIKQEIAGLLAWLNKIRKKEELAVIARKEVIALQAKIGAVDFASALEKYSKAVSMLPAVEQYTSKCKQDIEQAKKNEWQNILYDAMSSSKHYAGNVLKYIPDKGRYGSARKQLLDGLKTCYREAQTAYSQVAEKNKEKLLKEAQEGRKEETTPQQATQSGSSKKPEATISFPVVRYPLDLKLDQIKDEAVRTLVSTGSLEKTEQTVIQKYQDSKDKYGNEKAKLAAERTRLRTVLEREIQTIEQRMNELYQQARALYGNPDPNAMRQASKYEMDAETLKVERDSLLAAIGNLEKEHATILSKIEAYEKLDELAYLELRDNLNQLKESYAAIGDRNKRIFSAGGDGLIGITQLQADIALLKKEYMDPVDGSMSNVGQIPEPQPAGLPKLVFQKSTVSFDGYNPALSYIGPYYDYVDKLLSTAKAQPGITGNYPVETALKNLDSALGLLLAFQQTKTQIQEIENNTAKIRQFYETSFLGVDKTAQNPLGAAVAALEADIKNFREFQKKSDGWITSVKEKRDVLAAMISGTEDGTSYLTRLKTILAKAVQVLNKPAEMHKRLGVANYQVGTASSDTFFLKEGASATCENLQKSRLILNNQEVENAKQAFIAEFAAIPGLSRIDAAYNLGMEQFARQYLDFYFKGAYGPEHYVFLSIDRCLFFGKEYFDGLAAKIDAIPKEQMTHEHVLMAEMIRIVGDQNLALQMGIKRIGADSAKTTTALVNLAGPNWDGDTKQAIARFAASVEAKYQAVRGSTGQSAPQPAQPQQVITASVTPPAPPTDQAPVPAPQQPAVAAAPAAVDKPASPPAIPVEPKPVPTPVVAQTPQQPAAPPAKETAKSPEPTAPSKPVPSTAPTPAVTAAKPEAPTPPPKVTEIPKTALPPQMQVKLPPGIRDEKAKEDLTPKIKALYENMKRGYESRSPLGFAQCIAPDWQGTDGMTSALLWKNLMQTFKDYNDLRCTIQSLSIEKIADDRYKTTYDITLSGTLRKTKQKKEERSTVAEEVKIDKGGRPKITKTVSGRFWLVK